MVRNLEKWQQRRTSHVEGTSKRFEKRYDPEHPDWSLIQNFMMDYQMWKKTIWRENFLGEADTTGYSPDAFKTESEKFFKSPTPIQERDGNRRQRSDCWATVLATLFLLLCSWLSWHPSLCFTESDDSHDFRIQWIYTSNSLCLTHSFVFCSMSLHTVINSVQVHTMPTVQVPSALARLFFVGSWPFHSCL